MPRGLGASKDTPLEWQQISYRPTRRKAPDFVLSGVETARWRLDGNETREIEQSSRRVSGLEARALYQEALAGSAPPVASTSRVTLDQLVVSKAATRRVTRAKDEEASGKTVLDAIDLESEPDTLEFEAVASVEEEPEAVQHCICCQCDVRASDWAAHSRSLPHLLASDTGPNSLAPHIGIKETNPGRIMLHAQGFKVGDGLGLTGNGRPTPLKAVEKQDRLGIGLKRAKGEPVQPLRPVKLHESVKERKKRLKREASEWHAVYSYMKREDF